MGNAVWTFLRVDQKTTLFSKTIPTLFFSSPEGPWDPFWSLRNSISEGHLVDFRIIPGLIMSINFANDNQNQTSSAMFCPFRVPDVLFAARRWKSAALLAASAAC